MTEAPKISPTETPTTTETQPIPTTPAPTETPTPTSIPSENQKMEDLIRSVLEVQKSKEEAEKLEKFNKTTAFTRQKLSQESGLNPEYNAILGEELDIWLAEHPDTSQEDLEKYGKFVSKRLAKDYASESRAKDERSMYRIGKLQTTYGNKWNDINTAMVRVFAMQNGLSDQVAYDWFEAMPNDKFVNTFEEFYKTKYLVSGGIVEKMGYVKEEEKNDPMTAALKGKDNVQ